MARLRHLGRRSAGLRTQQLLEQFDLVEARTRKVSSYSGGMRRRLDLAVSLISAPPVLFLDEPTTGLDPRSRRAMWDAVSRLSDSGVTVLLTTQYLEEADQLADRIAVIDDGRVVAEGTADELKSRVGSETVEMFFAESSALSQAAEAVSWNATVRADADRLSLSVPTDGSAAGVKQLLDLMDLRNIVVQRLALHRPTLDEVFLTLTGQKGLQHV
jgi:ABC-2 type transport system ATP-binding protein